jgi:indolepyruvate ferredoxin oxidoreductase, beta subunit
MSKVTNVIIAGLGGQGVLKASDVLAEAAFRSGFQVKKSEVHGMAQRGGSVGSDVRFGSEVFSPMIPPGEADFLVVLAPDQVEVTRGQLRSGGVLIPPDVINVEQLQNRKSFNIALMGALSRHLVQVPESIWLEAIRSQFPEKLHEANSQAFQLGRVAAT